MLSKNKQHENHRWKHIPPPSHATTAIHDDSDENENRKKTEKRRKKHSWKINEKNPFFRMGVKDTRGWIAKKVQKGAKTFQNIYF